MTSFCQHAVDALKHRSMRPVIVRSGAEWRCVDKIMYQTEPSKPYTFHRTSRRLPLHGLGNKPSVQLLL